MRSQKRSHPPVVPVHRLLRSATRRCPPQVWTSLKTLNGREFCFMLNSLIRDDAKLTDEVANQVPTRDMASRESRSTRRRTLERGVLF